MVLEVTMVLDVPCGMRGVWLSGGFQKEWEYGLSLVMGCGEQKTGLGGVV